jgi:hypothetical protein
MHPPSLGRGFPRPIEKLAQLWKGGAGEVGLLEERSGAVKLECHEFGNVGHVYE